MHVYRDTSVLFRARAVQQSAKSFSQNFPSVNSYRIKFMWTEADLTPISLFYPSLFQASMPKQYLLLLDQPIALYRFPTLPSLPLTPLTLTPMRGEYIHRFSTVCIMQPIFFLQPFLSFFWHGESSLEMFSKLPEVAEIVVVCDSQYKPVFLGKFPPHNNT